MRVVYLLLASVLLAANVRADEALRVIAALRINHVPSGDAIVVQEAHDIYVRARDVTEVPFSRRPASKIIDADLYYSLGSSGIEYTYDAESLTLDLVYRAVTAQRLDVPVPAAPLYQNGSSATLAYTGTLDDGGSPALSGRATFALPDGQAHLGFANIGGVIYRTDLDAGFYDKGQNGEVFFGDQMLASGGALPSLPIFGIGMTQGTLSRTSGNAAPFERLSGTLKDPTTIRIDVASEEPIEVGLEPGPFIINGIPVAARVNAMDDLTQLPVQVTAALPIDTQLLAPGWHETNLAAGIPRSCVFACATYHGFAAGGSILTGDSLFLSSGPHAEYLDGRAGVGYDIIAADPERALQVSAGLGPLDGALISYEQRAGRISFGIGYGVNGAPAYTEGASLVAKSRNLFQTLNFAYRRLRFQYQLQRYQFFGDVRSYDLLGNVPIFHTALQFDLKSRLVTGQTGKVSLGILFPLAVKPWRDTSLIGTTIGAHQGPAATLSSQINTPSGLEIGGNSGTFGASYVSDAIEISGSSEGMLTFSGAFAFLHGAHFVRDTSGGYAVVVGQRGDLIRDTDGRVHTVGPGSSTAFPLPPGDRPTGIATAQRNVTIDGDMELSAVAVYPAPGAGTVVTITHTRLFAAIGTVADPRWHYGTIELANGASSPIGADGMFYFEELSAGSYSARISDSEGSCSTTLIVPASNDRQVNIGSISCRV